MTALIRQLILTALLLVVPAVSNAQHMLMERLALKAETAMDVLQAQLRAYGYEVAHVQKCDGGLEQFGYHSDFYRVVFFGKIDEVRKLSASNPELVAFLPLKIALFAEQDESILAALNPMDLAEHFHDPVLQVQFARWENDIRAIMNEVRDYRPSTETKRETAPGGSD